MRILILGSGGREHAIVRSLASEPAGHELIAAPGNPGIGSLARLVPLDPADPVAVTDFCVRSGVELVIVGPEAPLVAGVADALRRTGIPVFGPGRAAARLEGSKAFAKHVMDRAGVPTGRAVSVRDLGEAEAALDAATAPFVVKADGLAAGKGVLVTDDRDQARQHARSYLGRGPVLVEEFLAGPEVSLFFLADGDTVRPLSPAQDYKRAFDGDAGPNTGGMGAYSPVPAVTATGSPDHADDAFVDRITRTVAEPVVRAMDADGTPFVGLLYAGLVLTAGGPKVIEFNARFGDPETQVVLPRLREPLAPLLLAAATGTLESVAAPRFSDEVAVTVVLAASGYPGSPVAGAVIEGVERAESVDGVHVLHAGTALRDDGALISAGGRVLDVVAVGATFEQARERAYRAVDLIRMPGGRFRTDIAAGVAAPGAGATPVGGEGAQ